MDLPALNSFIVATRPPACRQSAYTSNVFVQMAACALVCRRVMSEAVVEGAVSIVSAVKCTHSVLSLSRYCLSMALTSADSAQLQVFVTQRGEFCSIVITVWGKQTKGTKKGWRGGLLAGQCESSYDLQLAATVSRLCIWVIDTCLISSQTVSMILILVIILLIIIN